MVKKIAYAIARESSDDRTLQNQYDNIHTVARELGYKIVKEFGENVTGDVTKKDGADPDFIEELRVAIRERKPDAIFCFWIDRLTRTTFKQGAYLNEFSVIPHIPIYFTRKNKWTIDPGTGTIDFDFLEELSSDTTPQKERENIKARTSPQRIKIGEEGYFIGHLSDGYCVKESWGTYDDGHRRKIKKIIIDEERRKVIEDIYRYYRNGYSVSKIADLLNSKDVPTSNRYRASRPEKFGYRMKYKAKDGVLRERANATWNKSLVSQILCNTWYKGERTFNGKHLTHDAIIPKEEWDEVEAIREYNKKSFRSKKEASKHTYLLSDLFYCGKCGSKMYGHVPGLNNHYYCSSKETNKKCGLVGICKENVEAIIYDIISNKAISSTIEGVGDDVVTDFFKLDKKRENKIKGDIENNNKIIAKLKNDNETYDKTIDHYVRLQGQNYDNPRMVEKYHAEINRLYSEIDDNKKKIIKLELENNSNKQLLSSNSNIKEILNNIIEDKELITIKQLFKQAIDRVTLFNADKRDDIVRIRFKNGAETEFVYCARLLGNKYILLNEPLHYNDGTQLIVSSSQPTYIIIDDNEHIFIRNEKTSLKKERELSPYLNIAETRCLGIGDGVSLKEFIKFARESSLAIPFSRLEEESDLAKAQRLRYQQWRQKYNTGNPGGYEPYILHNETYKEICRIRKNLYNKRYKIKIKKKITEEERSEKLAEIKRQLDALTVQVPLIKPRKNRVSKKKDNNNP